MRRLLLFLLATLLVCIPARAALAAPPTIGSPSAAVIETSTGTVVFQKQGSVKHGMASTTKLMTALVALDERPLSDELPAVKYTFSAAETRANLHPGEELTVADLVRAMMLPSANDAAQALAVGVGGSQKAFVAKMNAKAKAMGLGNTHFNNPIGLDGPSHRTTALDLAQIGVAAHDNPFLRATVKNPSITIKSGDAPRTLINRNEVLGIKLGDGAVIDGMKTGHTNAAGYSLVGSVTRDGVSLVSVVLGADSEAERNTDTVKLLRWSSTLFDKREIVSTTQRVANVAVGGGVADQVSLVPAKALTRVVPHGSKVTLKPVGLPAELKAPVVAGTQVAEAQIVVGEDVVGKVPLLARVGIEKRGPIAAVLHAAGEHWQGTLVSLLLLGGGTLLLVRAAQQGRRTARRRASAPGDSA